MIANHLYALQNQTFLIEYIFVKPETMTIHEEYYVMPTFDMIGAIGGHFGIFIGFSFYDFISSILNLFKIFLARICTGGKNYSSGNFGKDLIPFSYTVNSLIVAILY